MPDELDALNAPLNLDHLAKAMKRMDRYKAPGIDGFGKGFFAVFFHELAPVLLRLYEQAWQEGQFSEKQVQQIAVMIPKGDGRQEAVDIEQGTRLIALCGFPVKVLEVALAMRLRPVLKRIMHKAQYAIPGRNIADMTKLLRLVD